MVTDDESLSGDDAEVAALVSNGQNAEPDWLVGASLDVQLRQQRLAIQKVAVALDSATKKNKTLGNDNDILMNANKVLQDKHDSILAALHDHQQSQLYNMTTKRLQQSIAKRHRASNTQSQGRQNKRSRTSSPVVGTAKNPENNIGDVRNTVEAPVASVCEQNGSDTNNELVHGAPLAVTQGTEPDSEAQRPARDSMDVEESPRPLNHLGTTTQDPLLHTITKAPVCGLAQEVGVDSVNHGVPEETNVSNQNEETVQKSSGTTVGTGSGNDNNGDVSGSDPTSAISRSANTASDVHTARRPTTRSATGVKAGTPGRYK